MVTKFRAKIVVKATTAYLIEGETYTIKATTTNMSYKAGVPVAAALTVTLVTVIDLDVIREETVTRDFDAGETLTLDFSLTIPLGTGGKMGVVSAVVFDPNGNELADGSLNIEIQAIIVPTFTLHTPTGYLVDCRGAPDFKAAEVWFPVSNNNPETLTIWLSVWYKVGDSIYGPRQLEGNVGSIQLTLSPGQSYTVYSPAHPDPMNYYKCNSPLFSLRQQCDFWLKDEYGNTSPIKTLRR